MNVHRDSDVSGQWYYSDTMAVAVAWTVADLGLRQPLTCFEIKSLGIYPELNLDDDVYEQSWGISLIEGQFSRLFLMIK